VLEQQFERLRCIGGAEQVFANVGENRLIGQELRWLIVDKEYVDFIVKHGNAR